MAEAASTRDWESIEALHPPIAAILFNLGGRKFSEQALVDEVVYLVTKFSPVPVLVVAYDESYRELIAALDCGVRGYIPASVGIDVCVKAINLAIAGGTYVPAASVFAMRQALKSSSEMSEAPSMFTPRQAAIGQALRQGKANKIIAYELNMSENTVKVHVRNIMKKLKATNRTEVAYKLNGLTCQGAGLDGGGAMSLCRAKNTRLTKEAPLAATR